jgi:two-component system sensor histidine kinase/response regulator
MNDVVKCLLVDDREENLVALTALLAADDVLVLGARSGPEALELLLVHEFALALIDVRMPEMNGLELAELMRGSERTRQVPIFLLTAASHDQHRLFKGYESGAVDFLYKPIDERILRNKANVFFQLYRTSRQLARDLQERTETLRLNEMFAAVLGHDLRSPLSAILSSAVAIQRRSRDATVQEVAGRMISSGRRMSRMIDDMLDLARARLGGGIPLQPEALDLKALVERVVREHQAAHPTCRIGIEQRGTLAGHWDPVRLAQVVSNLLGNAIQHGTAGQEIRVRLDGTQPERVDFSVANGGTIPESLLPILFDPFRGVEDPSRSRGLGLGLYIVQQIVQAHRGSVEVDSGASGTTVFNVSLPRARA